MKLLQKSTTKNVTVSCYADFSEGTSYITTEEEAKILSITELEQRIERNKEDIKKLYLCIDDKQYIKVDSLDYLVSGACGAICGILQCVISLDESFETGEQAVTKCLTQFAKSLGYVGDSKAIGHIVSFLELKFPSVSDTVTNAFGGGLQHHLRDWSHHFSLFGLLSSILIHITGVAYGADTQGNKIEIPIPQQSFKNSFLPRGENLAEQIFFGTLEWVCHISTDMAGSSSSLNRGSKGTGVPGPILSFLKLISSSPIFKEKDSKGNNLFSVFISKLFNGTLGVKFDFRTELGIVMKTAKYQILNESIVRGFYFIRTVFSLLEDAQKEHNISSVFKLEILNKIDWESTIQGPSLTRMLTVSTGVMTGVTATAATVSTAKTVGKATLASAAAKAGATAAAAELARSAMLDAVKSIKLIIVTAQDGIRFGLALLDDFSIGADDRMWKKLISMQEEQNILYSVYSDIITEKHKKHRRINLFLKLVFLSSFLVMSILL